MTTFYDFLKLSSEEKNGFNAFVDTTVSSTAYLTAEQSSAFKSANAKLIGQQVLLEDNNLPAHAAFTITLPITITIGD